MGLLADIAAYPPAVFFMLGNELCERFSYYGMRGILTTYFVTQLALSESTSTMFYHGFACLAYLSPLVGSVLADSYFGRYKVILYGSLVYAVGQCVLATGSIPGITGRGVDFAGLFIIAVATGTIKPCVSAFAADQFGADERGLRAQFFSFFYVAINMGALLSFFITPQLRGRFACFGSDNCFPLAFGVPALFMCLATVLLVAGRPLYRFEPPSHDNTLAHVVGCLFTAARRTIGGRLRGRPTTTGKSSSNEGRVVKSSWLDAARPDYSSEMITEVRVVVGVLLLLAPLVLFWALLDQQGSTWILQARRLDVRLGPVVVLPEQLHLLNPLFIVLLIPLLEAFVYPVVGKVIRLTALRKIACGGMLVALAYGCAAMLEFSIDHSVAPPTNSAWVHRVGASGLTLHASGRADTTLSGNATEGPRVFLPVGDYHAAESADAFQLRAASGHVFYGDGRHVRMLTYPAVKMPDGRARLFVVSTVATNVSAFLLDARGVVQASAELPPHGWASLVASPTFFSSPHFTFAYGAICNERETTNTSSSSSNHTAAADSRWDARSAASDVVQVSEDAPPTFANLVAPNSISVAWQLPQYVVLTLGEAMVSATAMEFAYSQAAPHMKSVLQAFWLVTTFLGNLVDAVISGSKLIKNPAYEFLFYGVCMFFVMLAFIFIAANYKYRSAHEKDQLETGSCRNNRKESGAAAIGLKQRQDEEEEGRTVS